MLPAPTFHSLAGGPERSLLDIDGLFVQQLGRVLDWLTFHRYIAYGKAISTASRNLFSISSRTFTGDRQ
jgi:hypothetical protein